MLKRFLSFLGTLAITNPAPMSLSQEVQTTNSENNLDVYIGQKVNSTVKTGFGYNDVKQTNSGTYFFDVEWKEVFLKSYSLVEIEIELSWSHIRSKDTDLKTEFFIFDLRNNNIEEFKSYHLSGRGKEESTAIVQVEWVWISTLELDRINFIYSSISHAWKTTGSLLNHEVYTQVTLKSLLFY